MYICSFFLACSHSYCTQILLVTNGILHHLVFDFLQPELYGFHFTWDGFMKGLGGSAVGASPEYELAVFTLCHVVKPSSV